MRRNRKKVDIVIKTILEKKYFVNNKGKIQNHKKELFISFTGKYPSIAISYKNKSYLIGCHLFVWYFHNRKPIKEGFEIDHIDNDKSNYRIENLQEITQIENRRKRYICKIDSRMIEKIEERHKEGALPYEICREFPITTPHYARLRKLYFSDKFKTFKNFVRREHYEEAFLVKIMWKKGFSYQSMKKIMPNKSRSFFYEIKREARWKDLIIPEELI